MVDFEALYLKYSEMVYKYCLSLCHQEKLAEDLTQETFLKAIKNISKYDSNYRFDVWLCQIAKNTYFTMHQKNKRLQALDTDIMINSFEKKLANKEEAFEIHKIIFQLEDPYKEVLSLRLFGELSFLQIGELFQKNETWARVTFHRAKIKVKERLR